MLLLLYDSRSSVPALLVGAEFSEEDDDSGLLTAGSLDRT